MSNTQKYRQYQQVRSWSRPIKFLLIPSGSVRREGRNTWQEYTKGSRCAHVQLRYLGRIRQGSRQSSPRVMFLFMFTFLSSWRISPRIAKCLWKLFIGLFIFMIVYDYFFISLLVSWNREVMCVCIIKDTWYSMFPPLSKQQIPKNNTQVCLISQLCVHA